MKMMKKVQHTLIAPLKVATLMMASGAVLAAPLLVSTAVNAAPAVVNESAAATKLNQYLSRVNSLEASFSQTTQATNTAAKRPAVNRSLKSSHLNQKFSGTMQVKRPGQFRWETTSPSKQLIVASGQTVWIYDPDLEQAVRQKLDDQVGNTPALLLSGQANTIMKSFRVTQPDANTPYFVLYPKNEEGVFESLGIRFTNNAPSQMILKDSLGQQTTITFSNVKLNPSLNSNLFNFTPPKGTDVIDE
ncbi:outer membrane lipoprotein chaperone LolA [Alkanindiges sp. WGS2144]|uniref:outer membrane lipoprotein chaperone LolA n=1 Tax=Alkanindiges sp. WGS2144 TaxID=3366808 RepID=UPI00375235BF